jgi:hypothetical protein
VGCGGRAGVAITFDELKPVTTLFADIVGSAALGASSSLWVMSRPGSGSRESDEQGRAVAILKCRRGDLNPHGR